MRIAASVAAFAAATIAAGADDLPQGFVRLRDVAPTIRQDIRYAGNFNFTGATVPGYEAAECILVSEAAEALARAQESLAARGYCLKVYDCYRPVRSVAAFVAWSKSAGSEAMADVFYPGLDRSRLFALGFLAARSSHSRGIAVDVGLVVASDPDSPPASMMKSGRCDGPFEARAAESSLDFGTAYDCFSERSATADVRVSLAARRNRQLLVEALKAVGFRNYAKEWWHFQLAKEPATAVPRDFPIR